MLADGSTVCIHTMIPRDLEVVEELRKYRNIISLKQTWDLLQGKKGAVEKNKRAWRRDSWHFKELLMVNPGCAQCDWDERHAEQIEDFLDHHPYMGIVFDYFKLNLQEQLRAIRLINRMVHREGLFVIGLIEDKIWDWIRNPTQSSATHSLTEEWITSLIPEYRNENFGQLKEPEDLEDFELAKYFIELVSAEDLMSEGRRMHHCVGGYAGAVKDGRSLIFHLEFAGEPSTIELEIDSSGSDTKYFVNQHTGVWNKVPSRFHLRLGEYLVQHLNEKRISRPPIPDELLQRIRSIYRRPLSQEATCCPE